MNPEADAGSPMTTTHLGRLTAIPPKEVWAHEANEFIPKEPRPGRQGQSLMV
jgi:hypothetical protein